MVQKLFVLILALTITGAWIGRSTAQSSASGQVLRVFTMIVLPEKRDQLSTVVNESTQLLAATKGILWFKIGSDPATGEIVSVSLWNSQADIDAFMKSDARKATSEKTKPFLKGEPTAKHYQVSDAKK